MEIRINSAQLICQEQKANECSIYQSTARCRIQTQVPKKETAEPILISVGGVISMKGEFSPCGLILQQAILEAASVKH